MSHRWSNSRWCKIESSVCPKNNLVTASGRHSCEGKFISITDNLLCCINCLDINLQNCSNIVYCITKTSFTERFNLKYQEGRNIGYSPLYARCCMPPLFDRAHGIWESCASVNSALNSRCCSTNHCQFGITSHIWYHIPNMVKSAHRQMHNFLKRRALGRTGGSTVRMRVNSRCCDRVCVCAHFLPYMVWNTIYD